MTTMTSARHSLHMQQCPPAAR